MDWRERHADSSEPPFTGVWCKSCPCSCNEAVLPRGHRGCVDSHARHSPQYAPLSNWKAPVSHVLFWSRGEGGIQGATALSVVFVSKFQTGQLIVHRRYRYRGVIVSRDPHCQASDAWYFRNRTQPDRNQPWYHVLVHEGQETYVAEENLMPDLSGEPIAHPFVSQYFPTFHQGQYYRESLN